MKPTVNHAARVHTLGIDLAKQTFSLAWHRRPRQVGIQQDCLAGQAAGTPSAQGWATKSNTLYFD